MYLKQCSKAFVLLLIALSIQTTGYAQKSLLKKANEAFVNFKYGESLDIYKNVLKKNSTNAEAMIRIADCYRILNKAKQAEFYYDKALKTGDFEPEHIYYYAESLLKNKKYDQAKKWFSSYSKVNSKDKRAKRFIKSLDNMNVLMKDSLSKRLSSLDINSYRNEFNPTIKGNRLWYLQTIGKERKPTEGEEITATANVNRKSHSILNGFLTGESLDELNDIKDLKSISEAGNKTLIETGKFLMPLIGKDKAAINYGTTISKASADGKSLNTYKELAFISPSWYYSDPYVSKDGRSLYFSSDLPGGFGGMDIYVSYYGAGVWSDPVNLGEEVNTEGNEISPVLNNDGTLFFASDGQGGLGGFDIYQSEYIGSGWKKVTNLGYPINSNSDDLEYTVSSGKEFGILTSTRDGNEDLFIYKYGDNIERIVTLKGRVIETGSERPLYDALVKLYSDEEELEIANTDENGAFKFDIVTGKSYQLFSSVRGFENEDIEVSAEELKAANDELTIHLKMNEVQVVTKVEEPIVEKEEEKEEPVVLAPPVIDEEEIEAEREREEAEEKERLAKIEEEKQAETAAKKLEAEEKAAKEKLAKAKEKKEAEAKAAAELAKQEKMEAEKKAKAEEKERLAKIKKEEEAATAKKLEEERKAEEERIAKKNEKKKIEAEEKAAAEIVKQEKKEAAEKAKAEEKERLAKLKEEKEATAAAKKIEEEKKAEEEKLAKQKENERLEAVEAAAAFTKKEQEAEAAAEKAKELAKLTTTEKATLSKNQLYFKGIVIDASNKPINGVNVDLKNRYGKTLNNTTTGIDGVYEFVIEKGQSYVLKGSADEFESNEKPFKFKKPQKKNDFFIVKLEQDREAIFAKNKNEKDEEVALAPALTKAEDTEAAEKESSIKERVDNAEERIENAAEKMATNVIDEEEESNKTIDELIGLKEAEVEKKDRRNRRNNKTEVAEEPSIIVTKPVEKENVVKETIVTPPTKIETIEETPTTQPVVETKTYEPIKFERITTTEPTINSTETISGRPGATKPVVIETTPTYTEPTNTYTTTPATTYTEPVKTYTTTPTTTYTEPTTFTTTPVTTYTEPTTYTTTPVTTYAEPTTTYTTTPVTTYTEPTSTYTEPTNYSSGNGVLYADSYPSTTITSEPYYEPTAPTIVNDNAVNSTAVTYTEDVIFKVQIGAFSKPKSFSGSFLQKAQNVAGVSEEMGGDGLYKYLVGQFYSIPEAKKFRSQLKTAGFDGYIVAYHQGERITIKRAYQIMAQR